MVTSSPLKVAVKQVQCCPLLFLLQIACCCKSLASEYLAWQFSIAVLVVTSIADQVNSYILLDN